MQLEFDAATAAAVNCFKLILPTSVSSSSCKCRISIAVAFQTTCHKANIIVVIVSLSFTGHDGKDGSKTAPTQHQQICLGLIRYIQGLVRHPRYERPESLADNLVSSFKTRQGSQRTTRCTRLPLLGKAWRSFSRLQGHASVLEGTAR